MVSLTVCVVFPDLLGTYGDGGNGVVLVQRARWRGIDAALRLAPSSEPLPAADLYCVGGGEDGPELRAAESLRADGRLASAVDEGVPVLAVCGGYQILGRTFPAADGRLHGGLGLLDVVTEKTSAPRAVGELLAAPLVEGLPPLTGFENHGGWTRRVDGAAALARVERGVGNGDGTEGSIAGRVVGTYLHGPVLARNPALADLLLSWATGATLAPLDDEEEDELRAERLAAAAGPRGPAAQRRWGLGAAGRASASGRSPGLS